MEGFDSNMADLKAENEALRRELEAMKKLIMMQQAQSSGALDLQEMITKLSENEGKQAMQAEPAGQRRPEDEAERETSSQNSAAASCSDAQLASTTSSASLPLSVKDVALHNSGTGEVGNPASRSRGASSEPEEPARRHSRKIFGYTWSWMESKGLWKEYEPEICDIVEQAFVKGQNTVCASQDHVSRKVHESRRVLFIVLFRA